MITLFLYFAALIACGASQTCQSNWQCKTCVNATFGCIDCNTGQGLSMEMYPSPNYICRDCGAYCLSCINRTNCTQCNSGYGPIGSTNCSACLIPNCLACPREVQTCAQCSSGYAFYNNSNMCGACSARCTLYGCDKRLPGNCDQCDPGYGYIGTTFVCGACSLNCAVGCNQTGAGKCDQCDLGFGFTSTNSCAPCSSNCAAGCLLTGAAKCDKCNSGYGIAPDGSCGTSTFTIEPTYGPMAGGTVITIVTTWTRPNVLIAAVYIGSNLKADNLSQSTSTDYISSKITALVRSPPITDESLIDKPLPVILGIYPDFVNVSTGMNFTYKRNPTIYDINPRVIPLSGGIRLIVTGSNMASASNPLIRAVVIIWKNNGLPSRNESFGPCYQPNEKGTQMTCLSPPIYISQDFLLYLFGQTDQYSDVYRRRKRRDVFAINWLKEHDTPSTLRSRPKRSADIQTNKTYFLPNTGDQMQVSMYADFDGLQVPLDNVKNFQVFNPPNISCEDNIYFDSKVSGTITITGQGMRQCCGMADYTVRIGNGFCKVTGLTDNALTCEPPKDKPQQTYNDTLYCRENFVLLIDVGNRTYRCSCLAYVDNSKTTIIIIAATVGPPLILFIAIFVTLILVKKFGSPTQEEEESSRNPTAEKRDVMRQPNVVGRLNSYEMDRVAFSPGQYLNGVQRPSYVTRPTTQSGGYHFQNLG